jgi:hypothetical protein
MVRIHVETALWQVAREHLDARAERVGFFLADFLPEERVLRVRDWRPVDDESAGAPDGLHVSLNDESRASIIQWATAEGACLIEAHSHGRWSPAAFSPFDLRNLREWVPHLWWRSRGRPYAAIVTSTVDFDALAWIDGPTHVEQVEGVLVDAFYPATRATRTFDAKA